MGLNSRHKNYPIYENKHRFKDPSRRVGQGIDS